MTLGFAACVVTTIIWFYSAVPFLPLIPPLAIFGILVAAAMPAAVSIVFLTLTYFKFNELSPALAPLGIMLSAGSALVMIALFWHLILAQSVHMQWRGPQARVALLWLFATAGLVTAQTHSLAYQGWSDYSKTLLLAFAMLMFVQTQQQIQWLVRLFVVGGLAVAVCTAMNAWSGNNLVEGSRATAGDAALSNPNDLALILLVPLAFAAAFVLMRGHLLWRSFCACSAVCIGYAIVLTQSRGGLFGFIAVFVVLAGRFVKSKSLLLGGGAVFGALLYVSMGISDRVSGGAADDKGEAAHSRIIAWQAGINMARTFPLTGVGIGNFLTQFPTFAPEETQHPYTAHSIWFLILGELGIPGFVVFLALIWESLAIGLRNVKKLKLLNAPTALQGVAMATLAGLAGYLVSGSFLSYVYQWPLYVLLVLLVAVGRVAKKLETQTVVVENVPINNLPPDGNRTPL